MVKTRPRISLFRVLAFGLKFNLKMFPLAFIAVSLIGIAHGTLSGVTTFITQYFYDSVEAVITGNGTLRATYLMITALGATLITREIIGGIDRFMNGYLTDKSRGALAKLIHSKMARIDPVSLEDTKLLDDIDRATQGADTIYPIVNTVMRIFTFFIPYFVVMAFYLYYLRPQFIIALVLVFVPVLAAQLVRTVLIAKFEDIVAPIRREHGFYHQSFTGRRYYKDTRVLGAAKYFAKEYLVRLKWMNKARLKVAWKENALEFVTGLLSAGGYAGILFMLVSALLNGEISVGAFAAVFASIGMLFNMMREMIQENIGQMASDMGRAQNFIRFLDLPESEGEDLEPDYTQGIKAEQINFRYPNAEYLSVSDVNLEIKPGETIAIVGENGAGKSTLVRLLIGLYTPTEGCVLVHGMDTKKVKPTTLFKGVSGVFQRYQQYFMTLRENVKISNQIQNEDDAYIENILEQTNIDTKSRSFPEGLDTTLSREFQWEKLPGVDLSGGQWQRVAIARGLYRSHEVIVLDEPTAAIDPLEESRIYRQFVDISKGKTAIIVTHRLGSTKIADRVVVMDKGKIVEIGSHAELLEKGGMYTQMYKSQAAWYWNE